MVRGNSTEKDGHSKIYMKKGTKFLRKQVELCKKEDIALCTEERSAFSGLVSSIMTILQIS